MNMLFQLMPPLFSVASIILLLAGINQTLPTYTTPSGERADSFIATSKKLSLYRWIHRMLYAIAFQIKPLISHKTKLYLSHKLKVAGMPFGLNPAEYIAGVLVLCVACGIWGAMMSYRISNQLVPGFLTGVFIGAVIPFARLDATITSRKQQILHTLPSAIDLIALCLRAGQDFHGALNAVSSQLPNCHPLKNEFKLMAVNIALGMSRPDALKKIANRINAPEMDRFVQSILRAEQKGSSLADIFSIQADIMRTRRTHTAEQAASRASVLMLGPLMLIFIAVFLLLLGPFVVNAFYGTLV
ncbi:MAG: type II secretion system F family protein [Deltaproteobacteria bacterium]|nr:type II secretion system F family protein [Deltaproteobacteria bacterium]MBN2672272.1 type II secretion system F family protein [Deltaproteobacteria bacterium]